MRHRKKSEKFSRSRAQRKALIRSLLRSLVIYEQIVTTESKAKGIRPWMDRLISWGKRGDLHSRRLVYRFLGDHKLVKRLFDEIAPRFKDVEGGYTRVVDLRVRRGDGAKLSLLELTRKQEKPREKKTKVEKVERTVSKKEEEKEKLPVKEESKGFISRIRQFFKQKGKR